MASCQLYWLHGPELSHKTFNAALFSVCVADGKFANNSTTNRCILLSTHIINTNTIIRTHDSTYINPEVFKFPKYLGGTSKF